MSNPNFSPDYSTNQIYVNLNTAECLTDKLEEIDTNIEGKAPSTHTHTEYASTGHEHTEYAPSSHDHSGYASSDHTHTEFAAVNHTHTSQTALWQHPDGGGFYMIGSQTVQPSKALSDCANGWVLCWSDYDADTSTTNSYDQCFSIIPKQTAMETTWNGEGYMCVVPVYASDDGGENRVAIKNLNIYNNKIVGKDKNYMGEARRDAVLRAVYEF